MTFKAFHAITNIGIYINKGKMWKKENHMWLPQHCWGNISFKDIREIDLKTSGEGAHKHMGGVCGPDSGSVTPLLAPSPPPALQSAMMSSGSYTKASFLVCFSSSLFIKQNPQSYQWLTCFWKLELKGVWRHWEWIHQTVFNSKKKKQKEYNLRLLLGA